MSSSVLCVCLLLLRAHAHNEHALFRRKGESTVVKSNAILFHAFSLALTVFVAMPIAYCFIIQKQYFYHKLIQLLSVSVIFIVGLYAMFSFSSGTTHHGYLGKIILFLIIIQAGVPLLKYCSGAEYALVNAPALRNIHYSLGMWLLVFLFPLQFFLGISHITLPTDKVFIDDAFLGHSGPGFAFVYFGMLHIWNYKKPQRIINYETIGLLIMPPIEMCGELYYAFYVRNVGVNGINWQHIILDSQMLFIGIFCAVYWVTNVHNRQLCHALSVAFTGGVFGYAMLGHTHGDSATTKLHVITGQLLLIAAVVRGLRKYWWTGICLIFAGAAFTTSNEHIADYWEQQLLYDPALYIVIALCFAFHVAAVNVLLQDVYERGNKVNKHGEKEKVEGTARDAGTTESVPFLMDVE